MVETFTYVVDTTDNRITIDAVVYSEVASGVLFLFGEGNKTLAAFNDWDFFRVTV